jgi:nicotinamidase-related amidase
MFSPDRAALVLVDVQQAFADPAFALDATHTFDRPDPIDGGRIDADTLARVTAANLQDEFAQVLSTDELIDGP